MNPSLVFIQGAPAVGKSTIINVLREAFPRGYFIEVDTIRSLMGKPNWDAHDEDYYSALEIIAHLIEFLVTKNIYTPIFLIDCLTEKGIASFLQYFTSVPPYRQIILWADNDVLEARMHSRIGHPFSNVEIAKKMNNYLGEYAQKPQEHILFLDSTGFTAGASAKVIQEFLQDQ